jgi:hypothetical protein
VEAKPGKGLADAILRALRLQDPEAVVGVDVDQGRPPTSYDGIGAVLGAEAEGIVNALTRRCRRMRCMAATKKANIAGRCDGFTAHTDGFETLGSANALNAWGPARMLHGSCLAESFRVEVRCWTTLGL